MRPVRICFISLHAYHLFNGACRTVFGGAEVQLYYLATKLAEDPAFDVNFVVGDFGQPDIEMRDGVRLFKYPGRAGGIRFIRGIGATARLMRLLSGIDADIYVQRAAGPITGVLALFCKCARKKFVYMIAHDVDVKKEPQYGKGWLWWAIFRAGLRHADLVVSQHRGQKERLEEGYHRTSVVRRSAHAIPEDVPVLEKNRVLWVARCEKWKRPEAFIGLAEQFPAVRFVMICPESSDKNYFDMIRARACFLPNMEFVGYVPFREVDDYFLDARVFVNTSGMEGFPNTFIQAAKNKAVILSLEVDPGGILGRDGMGICAKGDIHRLRDCLKELLASDGLCREISGKAYRYVEENHDINRIIEEDKRMLFDLVAR